MRRSWAQLLKRVYEINPLICPDCGAEMRIISFILDPKVESLVKTRKTSKTDKISPLFSMT